MQSHLGTWLAIGVLALLLTPFALAWLPTPADAGGELAAPALSLEAFVRSIAVAIATATFALLVGSLLALVVATSNPQRGCFVRDAGAVAIRLSAYGLGFNASLLLRSRRFA